MNTTIETGHKYTIQWAALLAYAAFLAVSVTVWVGIFSIARLLLK